MIRLSAPTTTGSLSLWCTEHLKWVCVSKGALVCMSRRDIPVCPGDVIICRRSCAEPGFGLFAAHFLPHDVTFSINRWCQVPPCGGNWNMYTPRSSGQNALRTWPWSFLLITRGCFTLCKEWISLNSFLCIYNKNCHQANGDNRHLVPNVPIGLGRDIRDMPIACARTHPDANKHARHIPMYRPVHSGHANKCSQIFNGKIPYLKYPCFFNENVKGRKLS